MENTHRSELGNQIATVPRPLSTMRAWIAAAGILLVIYTVFSASSAIQIAGGLVAALMLLFIVRILDSVRIFELGLESRGIRFQWGDIVAYRLSWRLGAQIVMLVEQATKRELPVFLDVYESDRFRAAVSDHINLDSLVKVGMP